MTRINNKKKKEKQKPKTRFKYIDEVQRKHLQEIVFSSIPEKSLLTMMDDSGKFLSYTNRRYLKS
jgi:c-di-GMP-binding flagellar brake protein YcgR